MDRDSIEYGLDADIERSLNEPGGKVVFQVHARRATCPTTSLFSTLGPGGQTSWEIRVAYEQTSHYFGQIFGDTCKYR